MKQWFAFLSLLMILCVLVGCTAVPAPTQPATEPPTQPPAAPPTEPSVQPSVEPEDVPLFTRENFPRMDGSTSLVPLGQAIASALLGESRDAVADLAKFNRTTESFRKLMRYECDVLVVSEPNEVVYTEMAEAGFEAEMEAIATDALIFVVNADNPVDDLTTEQVRAIYAGEITNWSEVGGNDAPIMAFQRNEDAGSQALLLKLVMGDTPLADAPKEYVIGEMGMLMEAVKSYDNSANAIGYSVYYYANDMQMAQGLKILSIDGVAPNAQTIRSGEYPHLNAYYCVIPAGAAEDSPNRILFDWLVSEEGQRLVAQEGYVSISDTAHDAYVPSTESGALYSRKSAEFIPDLQASPHYGMLYPFVGSAIFPSYVGDRYSFPTDYLFGMVDERGCIAADAVYSNVRLLRDEVTYEPLPFWVLQKTGVKEDEFGYYSELTFALASLDGSFVTDCKYTSVFAYDSHVIACVEAPNTLAFDIFDSNGKQVFTSDRLAFKDQLYPNAYDISYGDGLVVVALKTDRTERTEYGTFEAKDYYFVDLNGEIVFGPYAEASAFYDGRARVLIGSSGYTYIQRSGKQLPECYEYASYFSGGTAIVTDASSNEQWVIDINGNIIVNAGKNAYYIEKTDWGYEAARNDQTVVFYDFDGNMLYDGPIPSEWQRYSENVFYRWGEPSTFWNISTGVQTSIDDEYTHWIMDMGEHIYFSLRRWDERSKTSYYTLWDESFSELFAGVGVLETLHDTLNERTYLAIENVNSAELLDADLQYICTLTAGPNPFWGTVNGRICCVDDVACSYFDLEGNLIFRYPLIGSTPE